jgi:uncharacterized protein
MRGIPRDSHRVASHNTSDSRWRNRREFLQGRAAIETFLTRKWQRELDYRLIKEIWAFRENRIAVRFAYEWHDDSGNWFRSYGNENWEFNEDGLMRLRIASINDLPITESERRYHWPLGRRPERSPVLERFRILTMPLRPTVMGIRGRLNSIVRFGRRATKFGQTENGGITAITGDYGYEPNGVIHDMTNFPEDTVLYFTNFGPIRYIDDDNNTVGFLDWQGVLKAAEEGTAKIASAA